jgi:hypothetical protein
MTQLNATKTLVCFFDASVKVKEKEFWKHLARHCNYIHFTPSSVHSEFVNIERCGSKVGTPISYIRET